MPHKVTRLGLADYEPRGWSLARYDLRCRFLRAVVEVEPEVLESLKTVYGRVGTNPPAWHYPAVPAELRDWGERWHLTEEWCWSWARERFAELEGEKSGKLVFSEKTHSAEAVIWSMRESSGGMVGIGILKRPIQGSDDLPEIATDVGPLEVTLAGWKLLVETEASFRKRASQEFQQQLGGYIKRSRSWSESVGARSTPTKRNMDHFKWLARFQVSGERMVDIWRYSATGLKYRAFVNAIHRLAAEIGLTLRK
jgi:hypothetical protein